MVQVRTIAAYFDDEITAMPNLTSVGTLTALTVDDVAVDGKVITMTGSSGDTFVTTVAANGATSLVTTDAAAAAANLQITADGTVDIDSAGVLTLDSGAAINIEPASGSAILLDGTISIDAGVVTGATSVTSTAFVGNLTGTVATATQNSITTATGLVSVGALDSGSITSGFGAIDNGTSNIRSATITAETAFVPDANDGADLGTTSLGFNDLFLADSGTIQFGNDQDVTLTHSQDTGLLLQVAGNGDTLSLISTDADANVGPVHRLYRNSASPADDDLIGSIKFTGRNDQAKMWSMVQFLLK